MIGPGFASAAFVPALLRVALIILAVGVAIGGACGFGLSWVLS